MNSFKVSASSARVVPQSNVGQDRSGVPRLESQHLRQVDLLKHEFEASMGSLASARVKTKPREQTVRASQPQTRRLQLNAIQIQKMAGVWLSVNELM